MHNSLESLEGRRLLSGNVTAVYDTSAGALVVHGDNKSNDIQIVQSAFGFVVTGVNGTKVNGSAAPQDVGAPTGNLICQMGNGDDSVEFADSIANNVSFGMDNGKDSLIVRNVLLNDLDIDTGNGDDTVTMDLGLILGNLNVQTGNSPDSIVIGSSGFGVVVLGNATIDGGAGPDKLVGDSLLAVTGTRSIVGVESVS